MKISCSKKFPYMVRCCNHGWFVLLGGMLVVSCTQEVVVTDTAAVKAIEVAEKLEEKRFEAEANVAKAAEAQANRLATQDALLMSKAQESKAVASQKEKEIQLAREELAWEQEVLAQKKQLEEEVAEIAESSNTISVFVADLRSRHGDLQLRAHCIPIELAKCSEDLIYIRGVVSGCRQGVVTNTTYYGTGRVFDIQTVTRTPADYVKVIKGDAKLNNIMSRYNNEIFTFEVDKAVEELDFENKRLETSWAMLQKGRNTYDSKLAKANSGSLATTTDIGMALDRVNQKIKALRMDLSAASVGGAWVTSSKKAEMEAELGKDGAYPTGLYAERRRLQQILEMARNTDQHADASSSGIGSNFDLQEKGLRDEYAANMRRAFIEIERSILHVVTERKEQLEKEMQSVSNDLAAIQRILDAHAKGRIARGDILKINMRVKQAESDSLADAIDQVLSPSR